MFRVRFTPEYAAGIIAGVGGGLVIHPLIERWIAPPPSSLSIAGVILACCGGWIAIYAQRNSTRARRTQAQSGGSVSQS